MSIDQTKLKKLKELLIILNDGISKPVFLKSFQSVINQIAKLEKKLIEKIDYKTSSEKESLDKLKNEFSRIIDEAKKESDSTLGGFKKRTMEVINSLFISSRVNQKLNEKLGEVKEVAKSISQFKQADDGKDADEEKIIKEVLSKIEIPEYEETVLDTPEEIANKLETLKDKARLKIEAILNLEERLKGLEERPRGGVMGGGVGKASLEMHLIDDEDLTTLTTPNGVITDFPLKSKPNPESSVKVFRNGQRQRLGATKDYTFSNLTITFLTAPEADEELIADYRK